uniref:HAD family hydrolase n=1 Tax=Ningiella ruwaisensis TaxID=2364274 RepID=UPI00109FCD1D|nr:HAD-IA family hydrolase [Ningiella ruwaisensis]
MFDFSQVKGIIFDLDDTLVHANLDFKAIKAELACPEQDDILLHINDLSCQNEKRWANEVVLRHELEDAQTSRLINGANEFIQQAIQHELPLAIVTRNCLDATRIKLRNNLIPIDLVLTREDALPKPHPQALLKIAYQWQVPTQDIAYIGDYKYDIQAAHNADMQAWLFTYNEQAGSYKDCLTKVDKPL